MQEYAIQVDYTWPIQVDYTLSIQADTFFVPSDGGRRADCARLGPQDTVAGAGRKNMRIIDNSRSCRLVSKYFQADWICRIFLIAMVVAMAMGGVHADSTFMNISNLPLANEDDQAEDNSSHTSISTDDTIDNSIDAGRNKMDKP